MGQPELHRPSVDSWYDALRLAAIVRHAVMGEVNESWQGKKISNLYQYSALAFERHYSEYWEKWTYAEKEEVIRRWMIYKLES